MQIIKNTHKFFKNFACGSYFRKFVLPITLLYKNAARTVTVSLVAILYMKFLNGFEIYTLPLLAPILIDYNTLHYNPKNTYINHNWPGPPQLSPGPLSTPLPILFEGKCSGKYRPKPGHRLLKSGGPGKHPN